MAKTLKEILEVYEPKSPDERRFKDKHIVVKKPDANKNGDDVFQATNIKAVDRAKTKHGYNPGQDEAVYEESELAEKAPPGKKMERMVKDIKKSYSKDGNLSDEEKRIAYATAWKAYNKKRKGK